MKDILKETASVRRNNQAHFKQTEQPKEEEEEKLIKEEKRNRPKEGNLSQIIYKNPNTSEINNKDYLVNDYIGKECLYWTNEYRKEKGLTVLKWEDSIWKTAIIHSENMALKKVSFSHDGFQERVNRLPFVHLSARENLYMCKGQSEYGLAKMAVDGWIKSPGHQANLVALSSHCAIAVFRSGYGEFYLTQIFVHKL